MKTIWAGAVLLVFILAAGEVDAATDYNFVLAGDSRGEGKNSAHGAGFRGYFQNFLTTGISSFDFIGTRQTKGGKQLWLPGEEPVLTPDDHLLPTGNPVSGGLTFDKDHEAIGGIRADGLRDRFRDMNDGNPVDVADGDFQTVSVFDDFSAAANAMNIVILDIGINDLNNGSSENSTFGEIFANGGGSTNLGLLDEIFFADTADLRSGSITDEDNLTKRAGNVHVVISTLYDAPDFDASKEQNRQDFNNGLQSQVNSYVGNKNVSMSIVDVDSIIGPGDTFDASGLHLFDEGYEKVALAYYDHAATNGLLGGDFDDSGQVNGTDIDQLQDLIGTNVPPTDAKFDLVEDGVIDVNDLHHLVGNLLRTTYGDTDLDRDVDISDFNTLASNFDPGGAAPGSNVWGTGNFDADPDIDITDFNILATHFDPGGPDAAAAEADPGTVDLIVNLSTGEVLIDGNAASISGFQILSDSGVLIPGDLTPAVLTLMIGAPTNTFYAEGAFSNTAVDGLTSLGILYDVLAGPEDLAFSYTFLNNPMAAEGNVIYVPEPASLALLAFGGLFLLRRKKMG